MSRKGSIVEIIEDRIGDMLHGRPVSQDNKFLPMMIINHLVYQKIEIDFLPVINRKVESNPPHYTPVWTIMGHKVRVIRSYDMPADEIYLMDGDHHYTITSKTPDETKSPAPGERLDQPGTRLSGRETDTTPRSEKGEASQESGL